MRTYYLFLDRKFCIQNIFENLQSSLEPGISYKKVKQHDLLPPYIVIVSIYKDDYFKSKLEEELYDVGYDKSIVVLKPLALELTL